LYKVANNKKINSSANRINVELSRLGLAYIWRDDIRNVSNCPSLLLKEEYVLRVFENRALRRY
jgi:hypothetical protein